MKKISVVIVFIVFLIIAHGLIKNTLSLWQKQQVVYKTEAELKRVQEENKDLKSRLEIVSQPGFWEREARDKLFYVKPDEQIVLVPEQIQDQAQDREDQEEDDSNVKKWIDLFF